MKKKNLSSNQTLNPKHAKPWT